MVGGKFRREMLKKAEENDSRLILALDVLRGPAEATALSREIAGLLSEVSDYLSAVKVGYPLVLETGIGILREIRSGSGLPVIADFKIADVPHISRKISHLAYDAGADAVIVHAFVGRDSMEAVVEVAEEKGDRGVIVVPNMSHPGAEAFIEPASERMAKLAVDIGATGVIGPATRPDEVRKLRSWVGERLLILTPGVGAQGAMPGEAIKNGADFEIVGRAIYESEEPGKVAKRMRDAINEGCKT